MPRGFFPKNADDPNSDTFEVTSDGAPHIETIQMQVPGQATAGTDDAWVVGEAPYAGVIVGVSYTTDANIAGHASNNRVFSLINTGAAGSGTTSVATVTSDASNSFTAYNEKQLTITNTAANRVVAQGDILKFVSDAQASGVADPGGVVQVTIWRS